MTRSCFSYLAGATLLGAVLASCATAQQDNQATVDEDIFLVETEAHGEPQERSVRLSPRLRIGDEMAVLRPAGEVLPLLLRRTQGPRLGVSVDTTPDGLRVTEVEEGSLALSAGVVAGDVLLRIGEQRVGSVADVALALRAYQPGASVPLAVIRAGEGIVELSGTLPEPPEPHAPDGLRGGFLGIQMNAAGKAPEGEGVQVAGTVPNSAAWFAGLEPGDRLLSIDGKPLASHEDLVGAVASRKPGDRVELVWTHDGQQQRTTVRLGQRSTLDALGQGLPLLGQVPMLRDRFRNDPRFRMDGEAFAFDADGGVSLFGPDGKPFEFRFGDHDIRFGPGAGEPRMRIDSLGDVNGEQIRELIQRFGGGDAHERAIRIEITDGAGYMSITTDGTTRHFVRDADGEWVPTDEAHAFDHDADVHGEHDVIVEEVEETQEG